MTKQIGRLKKLCKDYTEIENYEKAIADNTQIYDCHHKLETHFSDGTPRPKNAQLTSKELIVLDMYYNRPPEELIFLTHSEHSILHHKGKICSSLSEEHKRKISISNKGKHYYWKGKHLSEGHKEKLSKALKNKNRPENVKQKISEARKRQSPPTKGRHQYNNGTIMRFFNENDAIPDGFVRGGLKRKKH